MQYEFIVDSEGNCHKALLNPDGSYQLVIDFEGENDGV